MKRVADVGRGVLMMDKRPKRESAMRTPVRRHLRGQGFTYQYQNSESNNNAHCSISGFARFSLTITTRRTRPLKADFWAFRPCIPPNVNLQILVKLSWETSPNGSQCTLVVFFILSFSRNFVLYSIFIPPLNHPLTSKILFFIFNNAPR